MGSTLRTVCSRCRSLRQRRRSRLRSRIRVLRDSPDPGLCTGNRPDRIRCTLHNLCNPLDELLQRAETSSFSWGPAVLRILVERIAELPEYRSCWVRWSPILVRANVNIARHARFVKNDSHFPWYEPAQRVSYQGRFRAHVKVCL